MKPIRIYAEDVNEYMRSSNYYIWEQDGNCTNGGGCLNCLFELPSGCTIYKLIPQIYEFYKPSSGYVELTPDSHPEVFL